VLGVDGEALGVLPEVLGVLAGVLVWLATEVPGRLPVAEVAAPTAEERPSADAAGVPKAQRTARQVRRARTPVRRADERAQGLVIAWRASDAPADRPIRSCLPVLILSLLEMSEDVHLKRAASAKSGEMSEK
jgi:hypothetical protein